MCRLSLMNTEGIKFIEENYGLEHFFNYLERQLGGHGNGVCFIYNDGSYYIEKGVKLSNREIADDILSKIKNLKWVIYHTRLASVGGINDRNCHPFEHNGKVLAMNGTERNYTIVDGKLTDTENILLSSENIAEDTENYWSVFLGYENGKVFANKNYGSLKYMPCRNKGKVFASAFPMEYYKDNNIFEAPQKFVEDEPIKSLQRVKNNNNYGSNYGWYGRMYNEYYYAK